nr:MAG TPA: hypothetical protein [Caudoviricetes sp.]
MIDLVKGFFLTLLFFSSKLLPVLTTKERLSTYGIQTCLGH